MYKLHCCMLSIQLLFADLLPLCFTTHSPFHFTSQRALHSRVSVYLELRTSEHQDKLKRLSIPSTLSNRPYSTALQASLPYYKHLAASTEASHISLAGGHHRELSHLSHLPICALCHSTSHTHSPIHLCALLPVACLPAFLFDAPFARLQ